MVRMGFPRVASESHIIDGDGIMRKHGYQCPMCYSFTAEIPSACPVCKLNLVSSTHLARSYHHLFPVAPFIELEPGTDAGGVAGTKSAAKSESSEAASNDNTGNGTVVKGAASSGPSTTSSQTSSADDRQVFLSKAWFCAGCMRRIEEYENRFICPESHNTYCSECDIFIHESLHNSPGEV